MFAKAVFPRFFSIFCTFFLTKCIVVAQNQWDLEDHLMYTAEDYWKHEKPLQCYDCNSLYDPRCGDPFDPYTIGIVNCSEQKPPEHLINMEKHPNQRLRPTVCRKLVQKVEGKKRVVRECGYVMDKQDDKDCVRRSGTKNVEMYYCACTHSLCNEGSFIRPTFVTFTFIFYIFCTYLVNLAHELFL